MTNNIKLEFVSDKKERHLFYLRTAIGDNKSSRWACGTIIDALPNWLNFLFVLLEITVVSIIDKFKKENNILYNLYGNPNESKSAIFEITENGFYTTLGNDIKQFDFSDIVKIESLGKFVIVWLKQTIEDGNKQLPLGIPIYSNAFNKISRTKFIFLLNTKKQSEFLLNV